MFESDWSCPERDFYERLVEDFDLNQDLPSDSESESSEGLFGRDALTCISSEGEEEDFTFEDTMAAKYGFSPTRVRLKTPRSPPTARSRQLSGRSLDHLQAPKEPIPELESSFSQVRKNDLEGAALNPLASSDWRSQVTSEIRAYTPSLSDASLASSALGPLDHRFEP